MGVGRYCALSNADIQEGAWCWPAYPVIDEFFPRSLQEMAGVFMPWKKQRMTDRHSGHIRLHNEFYFGLCDARDVQIWAVVILKEVTLVAHTIQKTTHIQMFFGWLSPLGYSLACPKNLIDVANLMALGAFLWRHHFPCRNEMSDALNHDSRILPLVYMAMSSRAVKY
jgi:hypothetical protein